MHQRLVALALRDGSANKRHLETAEDKPRAPKKRARPACLPAHVEVQAVADDDDGEAEELAWVDVQLI